MITVLGMPAALAKFQALKIQAEAAATVSAKAGGALVTNALKAAAPKLTGTLANSIGVLDQDSDNGASVYVGASVDYDVYYQKGTSRQPARPYAERVASAATPAFVGATAGIFRAALR